MKDIWISPKLDEFITHSRWFTENILNSYRTRVKKYYTSEFENNHNNFPFMQATKLVSLFRNFEIIHYFVVNPNKIDDFYTFYDLFENYEEFDKIQKMPEHIRTNRLIDIVGIKTDFENIIWHYGDSGDSSPDYDISIAEFQGFQLADEHFYKIKKRNEFINTKFRTSGDFFNIETTKSLVNNKNFNYEFEEAIKAYNYELNFAAAVTGIVALETLLKVAVQKKIGSKYITEKSYIYNLSKLLVDKNIIEERIFHKILSLNELRRGLAHSKTGSINKWETEQILSGVKSLAEYLFEKKEIH